MDGGGCGISRYRNPGQKVTSHLSSARQRFLKQNFNFVARMVELPSYLQTKHVLLIQKLQQKLELLQDRVY